MDKRIRHVDRARDREARELLYRHLATGELSLADAVKGMRKLSKLTQPEFAAHRGLSVKALRQIESGTGNPTVETLNKIAAVFGLQVGFVPRRRSPLPESESSAATHGAPDAPRREA